MLLEVIQFLVPDAKLVIVGEPSNSDEYFEQVTWVDSRPQPTWADVQQARPVVEQAEALSRVRNDRHFAYIAESDPLFFRWQRGTATEQEWLDAVQAIKDRYPDPQV